MKISKIISISIALIILILIFFFFIKTNLTGKTIQQTEFSHTKAICNSSNFCQDYEITCRENQIIKKQPITGAVIQHNEKWQDPRNNSEDLCK